MLEDRRSKIDEKDDRRSPLERGNGDRKNLLLTHDRGGPTRRVLSRWRLDARAGHDRGGGAPPCEWRAMASRRLEPEARERRPVFGGRVARAEAEPGHTGRWAPDDSEAVPVRCAQDPRTAPTIEAESRMPGQRAADSRAQCTLRLPSTASHRQPGSSQWGPGRRVPGRHLGVTESLPELRAAPSARVERPWRSRLCTQRARRRRNVQVRPTQCLVTLRPPLPRSSHAARLQTAAR